MAAGRETISTGPSTWTHSPKNLSSITTTEARGRRRRFFVLVAVSRVLITTAPSSSTPTATGDIGGSPSARVVARTA